MSTGLGLGSAAAVVDAARITNHQLRARIRCLIIRLSSMQNSPARSSIDVGSVIADTYTIEALIGRGGMGAVFLASHKRLPGKQVAIKVLHAQMSCEEVLARLKRGAQIASR